GLAHGEPVGAVHPQVVEEAVEGGLVGLHLDDGTARVDVGAADVDLDQLVVHTGLDDGVEHLGEDQRVDDVTGELDGLGSHGCSLRRRIWQISKPNGYHA